MILAHPTATPTPTLLPRAEANPGSASSGGLVGDCNGDARVAINELIVGVNISLTIRPVTDCASFDENGDGRVAINELIRAVNNALRPPTALTLEKEVSASGAGPWSQSIEVPNGSGVHYRFTVSNGGAVPLTEITVDDPEVETTACGFSDPLAAGGSTICVVGPVVPPEPVHTNTATAIGKLGEETVASIPDAATVMSTDEPGEPPPLDRSVVTDIAKSTGFIYEGPNPIQSGVAPGTIDPARIAVVRGGVRTRDGAPIADVAISALGHPEYGQTLSRDDGSFDFAANGGGQLTLSYVGQGFLPAQRLVELPWRDWVAAPDVVLVPLDTNATMVNLSSADPIQVARGSIQNDGDGERQATVLVPSGNTAELVMPDGSRTALSQLTIRATEYTVGESGPEAMPAGLPPASAYTYAVELSADEALAAGASSIEFGTPLPVYVDDFLDFPAGTVVPAGYYDRADAVWRASTNGIVLAVVAENAGLAEVDVTGDGVADTGAALEAHSITEGELSVLANLYAPGARLWRVLTPHFTPWDYNWPYVLPDDAEGPDVDPPISTDVLIDGSCQSSGSVIGCERQVLMEHLPLTGTPFSLHYSSDRVPGRRPALDIELVGDGELPASLESIQLSIGVAGQRHVERFPRAAGFPSRREFIWDGLDAYGRQMRGAQRAKVEIEYIYPAVYASAGSFETAFGRFGEDLEVTGDRARQEIGLKEVFTPSIAVDDAIGTGLGGWTLDVHHQYDPTGRLLQLGNGRRRRVESAGRSFETILEPDRTVDFLDRRILASGPDGSIYFATRNPIVKRMEPDGTTTPIAGGGPITLQNEGMGDGGPALDALLWDLKNIAIGPEGDLYTAEESSIRRVGPDGIIRRIAGRFRTNSTFSCTPGPNEIPALSSQVCPTSVAVGPDGSVYFGEFGDGPSTPFRRVRRITPDGIVTLVAGAPGFCRGGPCGDGGPASAANFIFPRSVSVAPDGTVYVADEHRIRAIGPDGMIRHIAGSVDFRQGFTGDSGPATEALLCRPEAPVVGIDGALYILDRGNFRIRRIDQEEVITTVAGAGETCPAINNEPESGEGGGALQARFSNPNRLVQNPDGEFFMTAGANTGGRIHRIGPALPGFVDGGYLIPSESGKLLYEFDADARHLRTVSARTLVTLIEFDYDAAGRLATIARKVGGVDRITRIERAPTGAPTAIVGPFGDRTRLTVDGNGYLASVGNPAGETHEFTYGPQGLLATTTDPRDGVTAFSYDRFGRLTRDEDPAGGRQDLEPEPFDTGLEVSRTTRLGLETRYSVEELGGSVRRRTRTDTDGTVRQATVVADAGTATLKLPSGTMVTQVAGPDPRFGMMMPILASLQVELPSGLTMEVTAQRSVSLADEDDPFMLGSQTDTVMVAGNTTTVVWDADEGTLRTTSPEGRAAAVTIDPLNRPTMVSGPTGIAGSIIEYDTQGRIERMTTGGGDRARSTTFAYDSSGRLSSITDPADRTVAYAYDAAGRRTRTTRPDGESVGFGFDADGNLASLTPPGRPAWTFAYDGRGSLTSMTPPAVEGSGPTVYEIDTDGRLDSVARPDGDTLQLEYDDGGRVSSRTLIRNGTSIQTWTVTYDEAGRVANLTSPSGATVSREYDGALLTVETWTAPVAGSVERTYDSAFRQISQSVNGASAVAYAWDGDGFLTAVGDLVLTRDPATGLPASAAFGNLSETWTFDEFGALSSYEVDAGATSVLAVEILRDALGRIVERSESVEGVESVWTYSYDTMGRLETVERDASLVEEYAYGPNGNRTLASINGSARTANHDVQDRLLSDGTRSFDYDPNGRLISRDDATGASNLSYDGLGELVEVGLADGRTVAYVVDALGRRVGKRVDGTLVQGFLYGDTTRPVAELNGSGAVVARFVYAGGTSPVWMERDNTRYRLVTDNVGSVRLVVDSTSGDVVQRLDYDAFGNVTLDTAPGFQPFGFAGGLYDRDTGLVRLGVRDYDPAAGRWTTRDPIGFAGGDTNLYVYAFNDPVNNVDPLGLGTNGWASLAAGAVTGVVQGVVGLVDVVTAGTFSKGTLDPAFDGINLVLELLGKTQYDDGLDMALAALDLEEAVNTGSVEFLGGYVCGIAATALLGGGGSVATARAEAAVARATESSVGKAVASGPKPSGLQVQSWDEGRALIKEAEALIARSIDGEVAAFEREATKQAAKAAEESGKVYWAPHGQGGTIIRSPASNGSGGAWADGIPIP